MRGTERLISLMNAIADHGPASLTALSAVVDLPKPTVLRQLRALEEGGLVARDPESLYRMGPRILALAHRYLDAEAVIRISSPHMLRLREEVDETVSLVARSGELRVCIQEFVSSQPLKVTHGVGSLASLGESPASGLLLLAYCTASERRRVADRLSSTAKLREWNTDNVLEERFAEVRERGWVISAGGRGEGAAAITVPIHHPLTREAYALGVFCPESRFTAKHSPEEWIALMQSYAAQIQRSFEGEPAPLAVAQSDTEGPQ
jgi:IclR family acetate operon transcriptional repressor